MFKKKELQLVKAIKKKGWREKEKEAGSAWRFPPVCPPSTVKLPPPLPPCNRVIIQRREKEQQQQRREEQQVISTEQQLTREAFATKRESLANENFSCSTAQVPLGGEGE